MISIIAAIAKNGVIGNNNKIPWHLSEDLKHFRATTMNHPILMGRKTFESIGKALRGRENIVLTNNQNFKAEGVTILHNFDEALQRKDKELFVIGGSKIYELALPFAQKLYLTEIDQDFEGDAYFPDVDFESFEILEEGPWQASQKSGLRYRFVIFQIKSNA